MSKKPPKQKKITSSPGHLGDPAAPPSSEILLYQTEDGLSRVEVRLVDETVWLSLKQMADLFQRDLSVISRHISNVYEDGELEPGSTLANFATVQAEGERRVTRAIEYYNLDVIFLNRTTRRRPRPDPPHCGAGIVASRLE